MAFDRDRETSIPFCERPLLDSREELAEVVQMIDFARSNRPLHEALFQLHANGPVWDGDVISKSMRDQLLVIGACAKVVVKGEDGFNACTYFGQHLLRIYDWMWGSFATASKPQVSA